MQTTLENWEGQLLQQPLSPESFRATRFSIELDKSGHEIQQQHQVGKIEAKTRVYDARDSENASRYPLGCWNIPTKVGDCQVKLLALPAKSISRNREAVVRKKNGNATVGSGFPQLQQPLQQQQAERQLQPQQQLPFRNDFNPLLGIKLNQKTCKNLFPRLCGYDNLLLAHKKAKKRKSKKSYVQEFEKNLEVNLLALQGELQNGTYRPKSLTTFTVRDPKTRKISASNYRDRVVHHAICNLLEPIFERRFIFDSFANRKGKGTKAILERFDAFSRKVKRGYALKADIRHYFDTVDQTVLLRIIGKLILVFFVSPSFHTKA